MYNFGKISAFVNILIISILMAVRFEGSSSVEVYPLGQTVTVVNHAEHASLPCHYTINNNSATPIRMRWNREGFSGKVVIKRTTKGVVEAGPDYKGRVEFEGDASLLLRLPTKTDVGWYACTVTAADDTPPTGTAKTYLDIQGERTEEISECLSRRAEHGWEVALLSLDCAFSAGITICIIWMIRRKLRFDRLKILISVSLVCLIIGGVLLVVSFLSDCHPAVFRVFITGIVWSGMGVLTASTFLVLILVHLSFGVLPRHTETREVEEDNQSNRTDEPLLSLCKEDDKIFVETSQYKILEREVLRNRKSAVTVIGYMGDGKSAAARHLAFKLAKEGYALIETSTVQEIERQYKSGQKTVVLVDDPFGPWCTLTKMIDEWVEQLEKLKQMSVDHALVLILTSRKHVWDNLPLQFKTEPPFDCVVDFSSSPLTELERTNILKSHLENATSEIKEEMVDIIVKDASCVGFPQCCKLFAENNNFRKIGVEFFINQSKYIRDDLRRLARKTPNIFSILAVVMLNGGNISHAELDKPTEDLCDLLKSTATSLNLSVLPDLVKLKNNSTLSSISLYLTNTSDKSIAFSHTSMFEAVAIVVAEINVGLLFAYCDKEFLSRIVVAESSITVEERIHEKALIAIDEKEYDKLIKVLTSEIQEKRTKVVFQNPSWTDSCFCKRWEEYVLSTLPVTQFATAQDDVWKRSILHWAAYSSLFHVFEFLVNQIQKENMQADLLELRDIHGATLLHAAAEGGDVNIIKSLLNLGFASNIKDGTKKGWTPLYLAASCDKRDAVRFLMENGAVAYLETEYGMTPLLIAAFCKNDKVIEIIQYYTQRDETMKDLESQFNKIIGIGEIHSLTRDGNIDGVKCIVRLRDNVNEQTRLGWTPLHIALDLKNYEMASVLLHLGANPNMKTTYGLTPIYNLSPVYGHNHMQQMLEKHGAKVV